METSNCFGSRTNFKPSLYTWAGPRHQDIIAHFFASEADGITATIGCQLSLRRCWMSISAAAMCCSCSGLLRLGWFLIGFRRTVTLVAMQLVDTEELNSFDALSAYMPPGTASAPQHFGAPHADEPDPKFHGATRVQPAKVVVLRRSVSESKSLMKTPLTIIVLRAPTPIDGTTGLMIPDSPSSIISAIRSQCYSGSCFVTRTPYAS